MQYKWYEVISDKWKWVLSLLGNPVAYNRYRYWDTEWLSLSLSHFCVFFFFLKQDLVAFLPGTYLGRLLPKASNLTNLVVDAYKVSTSILSVSFWLTMALCETWMFTWSYSLSANRGTRPFIYHHPVSAFLWDLQIKLMFMGAHEECSVFCLTQSQWKNTSRGAEVETGISGRNSSGRMHQAPWGYNNLLFLLPEWIESTDCAEHRPALWLPRIAAVTLHHISLSHQLFLELLFLPCT